MKRKIITILSAFVFCMSSIIGVRAEEMPNVDSIPFESEDNGYARAYIYLNQTKPDYQGIINVSVKLVVVENPSTAELEIYDVELKSISSRSGEDVYGAEKDDIQISSSGKSVDYWIKYYCKLATGKVESRYTWARFSI